MKFVRNYHILLRITILFLALFLFMGCSDDGIQVMPKTQPARLIKVTSDNHFQDTRDQHFPNGEGDEIVAFQDWVELVFDKAVSQVIIDVDSVLGYATPNGIPPTTIWIVKVGDLDLPSLPFFRTPKKNVPFTVIYEDKTGFHQETFEVALGNYHPGPEPPHIDSSDPYNDEIDVNANRLNRKGIWFRFDKRMDITRSQIEVYRGERKLNWPLYWTERGEKAVLLPESENDWLLPGHHYEIHLVDFYDLGGNRGEWLEDGPIVIRFQTASAEPDGD